VKNQRKRGRESGLEADDQKTERARGREAVGISQVSISAVSFVVIGTRLIHHAAATCIRLYQHLVLPHNPSCTHHTSAESDRSIDVSIICRWAGTRCDHWVHGGPEEVEPGLLAKDTIVECRSRHYKCGESASVRGILDFGTVDDTDRLEE
jgi:hypothetical protein